MGERLKIRVSKHEDNSTKYELMRGGEKFDDVSYIDIIEMIMQFTSSLRYPGVK